MLIPLLYAVLAFGLPVAVGFVMARRRPVSGPFVASGLAALPAGAIFLIVAFSLRATADAAPYWAWGLIVWGIVALLCGFGLGMVGHALGSKSRNK
jgi:hypothetical protein